MTLERTRALGPLTEQEWRRTGACRTRWDLMFNANRIAEARETCAGCSSLAPCRAFGIVTRQPVGVYGGLSWEDRLLYCPICFGPKHHDVLGCCTAHELLVLAEFMEYELAGSEDYRVSRGANVLHAKTSSDCPVPHGSPHGTYSAYANAGCRCKEALLDHSRRQAA